MVKKRLSSVVIVSTVLAGTLVAPIATFADNYDSQIEQKNSEINDLKSKQIDSLESSINKINKKADELLKEQSTLREETVQLQKDIEVLTERIAKREEAIRNQARDVQVNNQSSVYVKALLDATSFTDALGRLKAMTTIVNANNDLVNQQKADKKAVEDKKAENEAKQEEIAKNQATLEEQKGTLEAKQADLNVLKASLAEQQATKESEKQALAEQKAAFEAEQKRVREQQAQAAAVQQAAQQAQATGSTSTNNASSSSSSQASSSNSTSSNTSSSNAGVSNVVSPSTPAPAPSGNGSAIVAEAYKHIGKPYVWGAKGPNTFDCSGFTRYVYLQVTGRDIGGWTVPQEGAGTVIPVSQAQPGDLYFWGSRGSSYHVAIALGGGSYIHAPQPGESVKVGSVAYFAPSFAVRM